MSATSYGWLVLAFPLAGTLIVGLGWRWLAGRTAGWIATAMIGLAFAASIGALVQLLGDPGDRVEWIGGPRALVEFRDELLVRHSVRRLEVLGEVVTQVVVLDGQHLRMAKCDAADGTRDRKGDLNVVVKRHIVERVAELALEARMNLV